MAKGRQLKNIVKSGKYLNEENKIFLIGNGVLKKKLISISVKEKTYEKQIFFLNSIEYDILFKTISGAKIGLMLLDPINKSKEYALANKISEYMLCGIVPLLSNHIEHNKLDPEQHFSIIINNYSPKEIAYTVNRLMKQPKIIDQKSRYSRSEFENKYNWENERKKFIIPFNKLINDYNY